MAFEILTLSIIPKGDLPVFHAKQYETGRPIIFDLVDENEDAYTPAAGDVIKLNCRKVDDNIVILSPDSVSENRVTFTTTEQLTACSGNNICEVRITDSEENDIATINFILRVQKMPTAGGLTSESSIYNLTEQIEDIIEGEGYVKDTDLEVLQSDWNETDVSSPAYIKNKPGPALADQADWTETDPLKQSYIKHKPDLKTVATSGSYNDLTDKPTIPTKTSELTNDSGFVESSDLAAVATSGYYDDLLNKPTIPAAQVQSDWNQTNTSAVDFIKNKPDLMLVKLATGNPCTFPTDLTDNLISVKANIAYNADGYTEANITRCGVNLWGGETMADAFVNASGYSKNTTTKTFSFKNAPASPYNDIIYDKFKPLTQYTLIFRYTAEANNNSLRIDYTDETSDAIILNAVNEKVDYIITTTSGKSVKSIMLRYYNNGLVTVYYDESGLFEGVKTVADFTPYTGNTYTIAFGQTVYGGVLDVTNGTLVSTLNADGTEKATPDIYTLTPTAIQALSGMNNIISDLGGDVEVRYVSGELAGQIIDICKMVIAEQGE